MKKNIFIILAFLVVVVAAWLVLFPGKNPLTILKGATPCQTPATISDHTQNGSFTPAVETAGQPAGFPITPDVHTYRADIAQIQSNMNDFHGSSLVVDGYFGPKTLAALKAYGYCSTGALTYAEYDEILMLKD